MISLPSSYASLTYKDIRVSHVPTSSTSPTPVILVTLYRPSRNNAFTTEMAIEIEEVLNMLSVDDRVKAIVFTGHGKMYCPGADLSGGLRPSEGHPRDHRDEGGQVALAIQRCTKPTIAAINGSAVGVGITMTLPMNIRIASSKAKIGFVFARRGIVMEANSSFYLPRLIGYSKAMHLITTGGTYPATSPLLSDLFSEIAEPEQVLPRALELAAEIASSTSTVSTHLMKDMIWRGPETPEETQLLASKILTELFAGADRNEGVDSFLQKRPAEFKGTMQKNAPSAWPWWRPVDAEADGGNVRSRRSKL